MEEQKLLDMLFARSGRAVQELEDNTADWWG